MEQRSAEEVTRVLRQCDDIRYFRGDDSEDEVDAIEEAEFNLSMVGTLRKNKRQIPDSFRRNACIGTARDKSGNECETSSKPEIIDFYNKTKCGTDLFDQMYGNYTCARPTCRWPMRFFLSTLDQASVNAGILYNFLSENEVRNRREFLKNLALSLIKPHLQERATQPGLHRSLANSIREILTVDETEARPTLGSDTLDKRKRCYYCKLENDRKTQYCRAKCKKPVCEAHRVMCYAHCIE